MTAIAVLLLMAGAYFVGAIIGEIRDWDDEGATFADIKAQPAPDSERLGALLLARSAVMV